MKMEEVILEKLPTLLKSGEFSDMSITCSDGSYVRCHKAIISLASYELQGALVNTTSTPVLRLVSNAPRENVLELLGVLYGQKPSLTKHNLPFFFKVSKSYKIQALLDTCLSWLTQNLTQVICLEIIVFANNQCKQGHREIYDILDKENSYKSLRIESVPNSLTIEDIDIQMLQKMFRYSVFTTVASRLKLLHEWLDSESNNKHTQALLTEHVNNDVVNRLLREDGNSFIQIKEDVLELVKDNDQLLQELEDIFKKALSQGYISSILAGDFDEVVKSIDLNVIRVLMTVDELKFDKNFRLLDFIVHWKAHTQCDDDTIAELASIIVNNIDIKQLFTDNGKLFSKVSQLITDPKEKLRFDGAFNEYCAEISTFKKLQKQASCDRWGDFSFSELVKLWSLYPSDLDEFNLIGMFLQWATKNKSEIAASLKQLPQVSGGVCEKFLRDACSVVDKELTIHKLCSYEDFLTSSHITNSDFEVFFNGPLPKVEEQQVDDSIDVTMATFKRQSGQFTQGSRIMVFKNNNRVIRIGLDQSRIPYLYKYQKSYGRSRSFSQKSDTSNSKDDIDQIDETNSFITVYGVLDSSMVNIPYLEPSAIEEIIAHVRANNKNLNIVVISRK